MNTIKIYSLFFLFIISFIIYCGKKSSVTGPNNQETQDVVKNCTLEPGKSDSIIFQNQFEVKFTDNAFNAKTEVKVREINTQSNYEMYINSGTLSNIYILTPHGQILQEPARVEFDISNIQLPNGLTTDSLEIYTYDGENFESQNGRVEGLKLICELRHFSVIYVRMKAFGACDIMVPGNELKVYKQNGYLCFDNVLGDISFNWYKIIWNLSESPENYKVNYQVSLYESPTFGFDKLVWAKQSCRIVWQNNGISYEPIWKPGHISMDWKFVSDPVVYDDFPQSLFWGWNEKGDVSSNHAYGDEYIINYGSNESQVGGIKQLPRRSFDTEYPENFMRKVFISDDMRKFIELSKLDENKKYNIEVKIDYSDWQFGAKHSLQCSDFTLKDVPDEESPNQPPTASISSPPNNANYSEGQSVTFTGSGTDPEDGALTENSLIWTSDRNGRIGTGVSFTKNNLSAGSHRITLTATDSKGLVGTAGIVIVITPAGQPMILTQSNLDFGSVTLGGSGDQVLTIQNTGNATLQVTGITFTDSQFSLVSGGTSFNVSAGVSHYVTVRFTPGSVGSQSGFLRIANNSSVNPKEINLSGTGISEQPGETVTDIDGNTYRTVKIGNQWWMAENLKVTHYQNGDLIPNRTDSTTWSNLSTGAYCNYNNDENNATTYGRLYNWQAVDNSRNIAPTGWHVPSKGEWQTLIDYLGGDTVAGGKMKEMGTTHWQSPNNGATNERGFSALPGGQRSSYCDYGYIGILANFWISSKDHYFVWEWVIYNSSSIIAIYKGVFYDFYSVRCVRD